MKQLKLSYPAYNPDLTGPERAELANVGYSVEQVIGDVDYKPGDFLSQACVRDLCEMTGVWKVIMDGRRT